MTCFSYKDAPFKIRPDIGKAHREYWDKLAAPGSWWTGSERVAIAQESRDALECQYCRERKQALSPYTFKGRHDTVSGLPELAIDAIHRIITDQGRIKRNYVDENMRQGLSKESYVELVGIVVTVFSIDEFHRALGLPLESLPEPQSGEISRYQPQVLSEDMGFVPTVPLNGNVGNEADLWDDRTANVLRALTLVPDAYRDWRLVASAQYLSLDGMANFVKDENRSINRMQMELVAGRVSSINECFY
jgi:hypothetical protein